MSIPSFLESQDDRQLRHLIDQMRQIAARIAELTLKQAAAP